MALKTYNGFNHDQRMRGYRWLQGEYAAGRRARPTVCDACGQNEGPIEAHSENYSAPFGDHIGKHGLCYRCLCQRVAREEKEIASLLRTNHCGLQVVSYCVGDFTYQLALGNFEGGWPRFNALNDYIHRTSVFDPNVRAALLRLRDFCRQLVAIVPIDPKP
jgi:hypothetical protein